MGYDDLRGWYGFGFTDLFSSGPLKYATGFLLMGQDSSGKKRGGIIRYTSEFQAGAIINSGLDPYQLIASDPNADSNSLFTLPDDYLLWPQSAPHDGSGNPLQLSAEDSWTVFNDLDTTKHIEPRKPMGIEIQRQTFQFVNGSLNNAIVVRMKIINQSNEKYDSVYFGLWDDTNIGVFLYDDITGVDSALGIIYNYSNPAGTDPLYWASGMQWLQTPVRFDSGQTIEISTVTSSGFAHRTLINRSLSKVNAAFRYPNGMNILGNSIEIHRVLKGLLYDGNPKSGGPFDLWYTNQGNCRGILSCGPFNFSAGDTQEVYYVLSGAIGTSHINATEVLLQEAQQNKNAFDNLFVVDVKDEQKGTPTNFKLYPNYPNPFNPSTTIRFGISKTSFVSLKIFNALGQEVATLISEVKNAGQYQSVWNGKDRNGRSVSSGIYIYRLQADGFTQSKKMLYIR